jgi:hypothetical protein
MTIFELKALCDRRNRAAGFGNVVEVDQVVRTVRAARDNSPASESATVTNFAGAAGLIRLFGRHATITPAGEELLSDAHVMGVG